MKKTKKLLAFLLAMVMVLAMGMTAMAASETTYKITIDNSKGGHIYEVYQIFTGDLSKDANGKLILSNVDWGNGVKKEELLAALNNAWKTSYTTAAQVADHVKDFQDNSTDAVDFSKIVAAYLTPDPTAKTPVGANNYEISGLKAGYYLVKDEKGALSPDADDAYTAYILKVVEDITVTPKSSTSSVEKKVKDINDTTDTTPGEWQDSADYDIGDDVPFQLTATLGDTVSDYTTYKIVFRDKLSSGLTYNENATVKLGDTDITNFFTITYNKNTNLLTVSCDDVKAANIGAGNGSKIVVEYTAKLNDDAIVGDGGNSNTVTLEYSNNPNDTTTGSTTGDKVTVFTYKVVINKKDGTGNSLTGAEFTLKKLLKNGTEIVIDATKNEEGTEFTFNGLDDGTYKLTETVTPSGYNTIDPITFTISANHDEESDNPQLTVISGAKTSDSEGDITLTATLSEGKLAADVVNESGAILPSTGGIGTTMFYVIGGALVLVAVVLLVTRKRMSVEK